MLWQGGFSPTPSRHMPLSLDDVKKYIHAFFAEPSRTPPPPRAPEPRKPTTEQQEPQASAAGEQAA